MAATTSSPPTARSPAPSRRAPARPRLARGYEARVVPLRFISAEEMEKVLKPYARPNAIVTTDNARNVITIGGTRAELENYLRTIEIFDVDWLQGMSVGVFPLKSGKASKVVADLEKVFGEQSKSPVAGMFRFMPLDGANAVHGDHPAGRATSTTSSSGSSASKARAAKCSCSRTSSSTSRRRTSPIAWPKSSAAAAAVRAGTTSGARR